MSRSNHCVYCLLRVDPSENFLHCLDCNKDVHITCLKRPGTPGDIVGDVFFKFRCSHCTDDGKEVFDRQHLPWAMMVVMALHNLSVQSRGLSHHGFFHWRTHIACFIEKNWVYLIGGSIKKKKKWIGTISGTLSHNTPVMFMSGFSVFNEQGWWKLTHNMNPKQYMEFYNTQRTERMRQEKQLATQQQQLTKTPATSDDEVDVLLPAKRLRTEVVATKATIAAAAVVESVEPFSRTIPYMGRTPWKKKTTSTSEQSTIEAELAAFLSSNISNVDLNLDLAHMAAGLTDDNDTLPEISDHRSAVDPATAAGNANHSSATLSNEWPDNLLDLDFLKNVDLMKQYEQGASELDSGSTPNNLSGDNINASSRIINNSSASSTYTNPMYEPRIVQVTNFQAGDRDYEEDLMPSVNSTEYTIKQEPDDDADDYSAEVPTTARRPFVPVEEIEEEDYETKYKCSPSLFVRNPDKNRQPWLNDELITETMASGIADKDSRTATAITCASVDDEIPAETMTTYEEAELLQKLRYIFRSSDRREMAAIPVWVQRIYRKLNVREVKRTLGRPIFDVDEQLLQGRRWLQTANGGVGSSKRGGEAAAYQVLDRYHHLVCGVNRVKRERTAASASALHGTSSHARLAGNGGTYEMFESPHTGRVLHPFVYRNAEQMPQWVKLMCELQYTVNGVMPTRATIDYCYVRPHHIAAVNGLLQKAFWPGIDMSECLSYPEFSIVALYKRLVVGCAFLVPDVGHNDAYISFMAVRPGWQRAGLASFMLYHLTQTCMGRDITLHVSATNAAVCLYQKFGFKMEEVILDFYDKYLPLDSPHSRHAFFLRMKR